MIPFARRGGARGAIALLAASVTAFASMACGGTASSSLTEGCTAGTLEHCACTPGGPLDGIQACGGGGTFLACICGAGDGGHSAMSEAGVDSTVGPGCVPTDAACVGKCGQLRNNCGTLVECGGCVAGETCGGGSVPSVCAQGACVPSCTGASCGASDGCGGTCASGACPSGEACVDGACACTPASCPGGCCAGTVCEPGNVPEACGADGGACTVCSSGTGGSTCTAGVCGSSVCASPKMTCDSGNSCCNVYGHPTPLGGSGTYTAPALCVRPVTVTTGGTLIDIGMIGITTGVDVVMGLYADSGGAPGALVAGSPEVPLLNGPVVVPVPSTAISAGAYWIAAEFSATASVEEDPSATVTAYCSSTAFVPILPNPFPASTSYAGRVANWYVLVE